MSRDGASLRALDLPIRGRGFPPLLGGEGRGEGETDDPTAECVPIVASAGGWPEGPNGFEPFIVSSLRLCRRSGVWTFFERGGGTRPVRQCIRLCIPTGFRNKAQGCPAKRELPWVKWPHKLTTPTGLRPGASAQTPRRLRMEDRRKIETQPRWGCDLDQRFPRVAPTSQPWALLRNPFGISTAKMSKLQARDLSRRTARRSRAQASPTVKLPGNVPRGINPAPARRPRRACFCVDAPAQSPQIGFIVRHLRIEGN